MHYGKCYVRDMNEGLGEFRDELEVGRCWEDLCGASDTGAWPRTVKNGFPKGGGVERQRVILGRGAKMSKT